MADLADILEYFCKHYPHPGDLSKARLTKMVYLADWKLAITEGRQMSSIPWKFNHYGPYVDDVINLARSDARFGVISDETIFGTPKDVISLRSDFQPTTLSDEDIAALQHVIDKTSKLTWDAFIRLVYSTYPVLVSERHSELDLVDLARRYRQEQFVS